MTSRSATVSLSFSMINPTWPVAAADDYLSLTLIETAHVFDFDEAAVRPPCFL